MVRVGFWCDTHSSECTCPTYLSHLRVTSAPPSAERSTTSLMNFEAAGLWPYGELHVGITVLTPMPSVAILDISFVSWATTAYGLFAFVCWCIHFCLVCRSGSGSMPPRRAPHLKGVPLTLGSTAESIESRIRRLRPGSSHDGAPPPVIARVGTQSGVASSSGVGQAPITEGLRADAPFWRNVRGGSYDLSLIPL